MITVGFVRMVRLVNTTGGVGSPEKPPHGAAKIEIGEPGEPQTTKYSFERHEERTRKNSHYKETLRFGVHRVHHPGRIPATSCHLSGEPTPPPGQTTPHHYQRGDT